MNFRPLYTVEDDEMDEYYGINTTELTEENYIYNVTEQENEPVVCYRYNEPVSHVVYHVFRFVVGYLLPFIVISK